MVAYSEGTGVKLSGSWDLSGVVMQIESLSTLNQLESGLEKYFSVDCGGIDNVDMSGLQLLHVWMQCVRLRGGEPELVNLPETMRRAIRRLGLENCFANFSAEASPEKRSEYRKVGEGKLNAPEIYEVGNGMSDLFAI